MSGESLEELRALNYPIKIHFDKEGKTFVAEYLDLPGCTAYGETVEEAYRRAEEAKTEWLRVSLEQGLPIPKPSQPEEHSGRILIRVPSSLHAMLADKANLHGASLNQYIVHLLSGAVVGDVLSSQLNELRNSIAQLEGRVAELALILTRQNVPTGTFLASTAYPPYQGLRILAPYATEIVAQGVVSGLLGTEENYELPVTDLTPMAANYLRSVHGREQRARVK